MLNTPTDKKLTSNPLIVSPYFNDRNISALVMPPVPTLIITETDIPIVSETGSYFIEE